MLADKYIMGLYEQLEDEVIADIARRVKKTGRYTETAELMAKSMVEQGYSAQKIQAEVMKLLRADKAYQMTVAENTKAYKQEIQNIIDATVKAAKEAGDTLVAEAGNMAWNNDLSMWEEHGVDLKKPNTMNQLLTAFKAQTVGELRNLTKSMGFKNTVLGTTGVLNAYQREMDIALLKVATGTFSYDQAVDDCVHRLAQSGLRSIDYASGRTYQLDTAARMSVRTGMSQLAGKIMEANLENTGQDLVITSQHMGSRPEHAPWQNKVFSYSGKSKKYPDFFKETGYGTAAGLKGVNCTHDFYPFWEGASIIPEDLKEPVPVTINGKEYTYYEATQQQRKMERNIRATKREIEAQNAIGGSTTELRSKLRKQTAEYKSFSVDAGLKVRDNRLRVASGTSDLKKVSGRKLDDEQDYLKLKKEYDKEVKRVRKLEKETDDLLDQYMDAMGTPDEARIEKLHSKKYEELESLREVVKDLKAQLSGKEAKAVRQIEKNFADLTGIPIDRVHMTGLQYDTAEMIYESYDTVLKKFPELKGNLAKFTYDGVYGDAYASCVTLTGEIQAHGIFAKYDDLVKQYADDVAKGFHPIGTDHRSIIVHELGHALDGYMTKQRLLGADVDQFGIIRTSSKTIKDMTLKFLGFDRQEIVNELKNQGLKTFERRDILEQREKEFIEKHVSGYATGYDSYGNVSTKYPEREFFAECFAEYVMSDNPRETSRIFGEIIETALGR